MEAQNTVNLRPRTLLELIDQAFRLYRNNFLTFVGIVAIALVPVQLIQLVLNYFVFPRSSSNASSALLGVYAANFFALLLTLIFVNGVATAALTSAITSCYLGEKITISSAYSKIRNVWGRLLGTLLLLGLMSILVMIWTIVPCAGWLTGFGILLFLALAINPLVAPVVVIENLSGTKAIRRAWELVRRRFWWAIGYFAIIVFFNLLVIQGPVQLVSTVVQRYITTSIASSQQISYLFLELMANSIVALLLSLIYIPLQCTCATLAYFDLRIRQEGFDLAMMANQTTESQVSAVDLAGQTSAPATGPLVTWKEIGYFVVIEIGGIAIYFLLFFIIGSMILAGT